MEKIYKNTEDQSKIVEAKPETIDFLLNYSRSLKITKAKGGLQFESNLN